MPEIEWEYREENLAGAYLTQAIDAFFQCHQPDALYPKRPPKELQDQSNKDKILDMMLAAGKRLELARTSVLFSALAAEAYINQFLWREGPKAGLAKNDIEALDRLPTAEKFVLTPRLILGQSLFGRGRAPIQEIRALFKLRDKLVHPKLRRVKVRKHHLFDQPGFEDYNPESSARFMVAVAKAAAALASATDPPTQVDGTAAMLSERGQELIKIGTTAKSQLPPRPKPLRLRLPKSPWSTLGIPPTATGPLSPQDDP